jgi:hypothetical protein
LQQDTIPQSHFARAQANIDARSKKLQNLQRGIAESGDEREVLDDFLRYLSIESTLETRYMAYDRIARLQLGSLSSFIVQR